MHPLLVNSGYEVVKQHIEELHRQADGRRVVGTTRKHRRIPPKAARAWRLHRAPAA